MAAAVLGTAVAYEIDGFDAQAGIAWSVVIKSRAFEIERLEDLIDAADLRCFRGTPRPNIATSASSPTRSAAGIG